MTEKRESYNAGQQPAPETPEDKFSLALFDLLTQHKDETFYPYEVREYVNQAARVAGISLPPSAPDFREVTRFDGGSTITIEAHGKEAEAVIYQHIEAIKKLFYGDRIELELSEIWKCPVCHATQEGAVKHCDNCGTFFNEHGKPRRF